MKHIIGMTLSVLLMGCMGSGAMKTDLSKSLLVTEEGLVEKKSVTPLVQQLLLDPEVVRLLFAKNEKDNITNEELKDLKSGIEILEQLYDG